MGRRNENESRRSEAVGFRTEKRFITEQTVHSRYASYGYHGAQQRLQEQGANGSCQPQQRSLR